jgi:hypothetical protein
MRVTAAASIENRKRIVWLQVVADNVLEAARAASHACSILREELVTRRQALDVLVEVVRVLRRFDRLRPDDVELAHVDAEIISGAALVPCRTPADAVLATGSGESHWTELVSDPTQACEPHLLHCRHHGGVRAIRARLLIRHRKLRSARAPARRVNAAVAELDRSLVRDCLRKPERRYWRALPNFRTVRASSTRIEDKYLVVCREMDPHKRLPLASLPCDTGPRLRTRRHWAN